MRDYTTSFFFAKNKASIYNKENKRSYDYRKIVIIVNHKISYHLGEHYQK